LVRYQDILGQRLPGKTPNVEIECSKSVIGTFQRRWECSQIKTLDSGRYNVRFYSGKDPWTLRFLAKSGVEAVIIKPERLRKSMAEFLLLARKHYN